MQKARVCFLLFCFCVSRNVPLLVEIKSQAGKDEGEERHEDGDGDGAAVGGAVGLGVGDSHVLSHAQTWKGAKDFGASPIWMTSEPELQSGSDTCEEGDAHRLPATMTVMTAAVMKRAMMAMTGSGKDPAAG